MKPVTRHAQLLQAIASSQGDGCCRLALGKPLQCNWAPSGPPSLEVPAVLKGAIKTDDLWGGCLFMLLLSVLSRCLVRQLGKAAHERGQFTILAKI